MNNVSNPIIINQYYCDSPVTCTNQVISCFSFGHFYWDYGSFHSWKRINVTYEIENINEWEAHWLHLLQTSAVKIESITFCGIRGTSASEDAVILACSDSYPCKRLYLKDIQLTTSSGTAKSFCWEAYGTSSGLVYPVPCISSGDMIIRHLVKSNSTSSRAYDYALFWAKKLWRVTFDLLSVSTKMFWTIEMQLWQLGFLK